MEKKFSHEKLIVYNRSLEFVEFVENLLSRFKDKLNVYDQLDRSSTSIPLNIAEGTGKFTIKDKNRYYDIGRGSAVESAACLDVLLRRNRITIEENTKGKEILFEIVSMLIGLIKSNSDRVYDEKEDYSA
ncbi:MAG: four helix bundle protein [Ignavibacteriales bacterium]|nr:MAG: four helix bundle protein [Ignavibacteriales bacterium]